MAANPKNIYTYEDYLALERASDIKHEYFMGEVFAMAGAEPVHNEIVSNTHFVVTGQVVKHPCKVYGSDQRVKTLSGLSTYPDLSVVCGERHFNEDRPRALLNPTALFEVLSPSTEAYDRGDKFHHYRSLPSLQEYVLISSNRQRLEYFRRLPNDNWHIAVLDDPDSALEMPALGCRLTCADIYRDVDFEP